MEEVLPVIAGAGWFGVLLVWIAVAVRRRLADRAPRRCPVIDPDPWRDWIDEGGEG